MGQPQELTDQQQRDAHLVRQTAALETIAAKVTSIQTYVAYTVWASVILAVLLFLFFGTGGAAIL